MYASAIRNTTAANVTNTGSMYAAGSQSLAASGALTNTSLIAAQGNTSISANSLASGAGSLLAAGLDADGVLEQTGNLTVTTTQGMSATGQNLAAGSASRWPTPTACLRWLPWHRWWRHCPPSH